MSRERLQRLNTLLGMKEKAMEKAGEMLKQAREQFAAGKSKHDQIVSYRQDYVEQLHRMGDSGCTLGRLRNRIDFINQLDAILIQLNQQLSQLAKFRTQCEKKFLQAKAEKDAVIRLIERVKLQRSEQLARLEQKESDEYAQKQWYSKNSTNNPDKRGG
ncbi:flagellar protein FliJ [Legionella rubrilucens]|uniref:Flagellar FliJ protein n=1 Tax=Legionella rubrilucens TaxID=458 RepID=A0A0W0XWL7_9GAMM|nr:flagellar export protein FliJ [Legionella rubrilucens]KTD48784.1 flagellar protein FliJ [Legionella rubrilucens]